jgi:hypothetical protein
MRFIPIRRNDPPLETSNILVRPPPLNATVCPSASIVAALAMAIELLRMIVPSQPKVTGSPVARAARKPASSHVERTAPPVENEEVREVRRIKTNETRRVQGVIEILSDMR